ncbi:MAG: NYN domain-containing protein, partial [bacterium]|nr:NYN domain-containing protein [bacterium]
MTKKVVAYIDGFNLYFGLKSKGWNRYYWLNLQGMVLSLLKPYQQLIYTKYFTAKIKDPPDKQLRQKIYLETLGTLPEFSIYYGKYQMNPRICPRCGYQELIPSEKMTDVNIATELLADAFQNNFDTAIIIS